MGTKLNFYFKQGISSLKRSTLVILGLSLAISTVAGLNYYLDSYQTQALEQSYGNLADIDLPMNKAVMDEYNISDTNYYLFNSTINTFEKYDLHYSQWSAYQLVSSNDIVPETGEYIKYFLTTSDFYTSLRFLEYFSIVNGTYPIDGQEILIDYAYARQKNLSVGDLIEYNYSIALSAEDLSFEFNSTTIASQLNLTVAGIYLPHYPVINTIRSYNTFLYYKPPNSDDILTNENIFSPYNYYPNTLTFMNYDFQNSTDHQLYKMWMDLNDQFQNVNLSTSYYMDRDIGLFGVYDRESYSYRQISSTAREINYKVDYLIEPELSGQFRYVNNILGHTLSNYAEEVKILRVILQFMNLPILGFGIFIGVFSFRLTTKERSEEFLLLRSKGIPQRMITNQFLMEATILGIISSTIALLAGRGTYEIFKFLFKDIIGGNLMFPIQFRLHFTSLFLTYVIGIILTIISCLSSIKSINRLESSELLTELGSDDLDVIYDETSLFTVNSTQRLTLADTPFMERAISNSGIETDIQKTSINAKNKKKSRDTLFSKSKNSTDSDFTNISSNSSNIKGKKAKKPKSKKSRDENVKLYRNTVKKKEKKIRKFGWILITVSLFPLIFLIINWLSQIPFIPDSIINFAESITLYLNFVVVFAVFSPLLLVIGFYRILIKENPSRFAKMIKRVAHIFVKQKDYLIALQMIKQKDVRRFINLLAIFSSLFAFANIFFISTNAMEIIDSNYNVGADVKIRFRESYLFDNLEAINSTNLLQMEENTTQSFLVEGTPAIESSAIYVRIENRIQNYYEDEYEFFINISKYIQLIQEDNKRMPSKDYATQLQNAAAFFDSPQNHLIPGVIVTEDYLKSHSYEVGETISVTHQYFNETLNSTETISNSFQIVAALPFFIGLWEFLPYRYFLRPGIIFNLEIYEEFHYEAQDFDYNAECGQFLDIKNEFAQTSDSLQNYLALSPSDLLLNNRVYFYSKSVLYDGETTYGSSEFFQIYQIIYAEFYIIGAITAISLAIFMLGMLKQNKFLNGLFLSRGMGWRGLNKFMLSELAIIFVLGMGLGLICGIFTAFMLLKTVQRIEYGGRVYPMFAKPGDFLWIYTSIIGMAFLIYSITFYFESRKNVTEYFHKF